MRAHSLPVHVRTSGQIAAPPLNSSPNPLLSILCKQVVNLPISLLGEAVAEKRSCQAHLKLGSAKKISILPGKWKCSLLIRQAAE